MSFDVYLQCFGESADTGIPRTDIRSLFPVNEDTSDRDYWRVQYDPTDPQYGCDLIVGPLPSDANRIGDLCVHRPCDDLRLWNALATLLRMGRVVVFWPEGPPVVADETSAVQLPADVVDTLGPPAIARSGEELLRLLRAS